MCVRARVCVCVCLMCKRFQHIRAHQRAYQHITSSCRNFEEIDFCRLIFSKVEIDCVILLAEHYCIYELIYVQREKEPRVKYARYAIQTRIQTKRKQNISLVHLTISIQAMNARLYKQMNARFCSFLYNGINEKKRKFEKRRNGFLFSYALHTNRIGRKTSSH